MPSVKNFSSKQSDLAHLEVGFVKSYLMNLSSQFLIR